MEIIGSTDEINLYNKNTIFNKNEQDNLSIDNWNLFFDFLAINFPSMKSLEMVMNLDVSDTFDLTHATQLLADLLPSRTTNLHGYLRMRLSVPPFMYLSV